MEEVIDKTWNHAGKCKDEKDHFLNASIGLASEAGEVLDCHKKLFYHRDKDYSEEIKLEIGDVFYYLIKIMDLHNLTLEEVLEANRVKLMARYEVEQR